MGRARQDKDDRDDDTDDADEASAAREFLLARLAIARGQLRDAVDGLDEALSMFASPDGDASGKKRRAALDVVDASIAEAARAVQLAIPALDDIDPTEEEPEDDEDDQ